ncbi:hypothetical protein CC78DRAFT_575567 [Lojkania enalia]|uniref:Uncharacterized protein n=1 Tax=Lojkania enalia TaxID=147567 RepID=A0A9P4TPC6_9PLEO|nr:hypothetical protein CC78DRAFT_575567 [Didymosphaeria enalia]
MKLQRSANREFIPIIVSTMHAVKAVYADTSGVGCFRCMKDHMKNHINDQRDIMFKDATKAVKGHLNKMCSNLEQSMENKVDHIFGFTQMDYVKKELRDQIKALLMDVDTQFKNTANGEYQNLVDEDDFDAGELIDGIIVDDEDGEDAFESADEESKDDSEGDPGLEVGPDMDVDDVASDE